jgi:hypothetical protein
MSDQHKADDCFSGTAKSQQEAEDGLEQANQLHFSVLLPHSLDYSSVAKVVMKQYRHAITRYSADRERLNLE